LEFLICQIAPIFKSSALQTHYITSTKKIEPCADWLTIANQADVAVVHNIIKC
jgi:hypothetical protein